jgi:hypothetical protein
MTAVVEAVIVPLDVTVDGLAISVTGPVATSE